MEPRGLRWEQQTYTAIAQWRLRVLTPLVKLLTAARVTPTGVTVIGLILMIVAAFLMSTRPRLAALLVLLSIAADLVDGALARYQKIASDRGKFIDMVADSVIFTIFISGLVAAGFVSGLVAVMLAYMMGLSKVLRVIRNSRFLPTDWHFKTVAGLLPSLTGGLLYGLFVLTVVFNLPNFLPPLALLGTVVLIGDSFVNFRALSKPSHR